MLLGQQNLAYLSKVLCNTDQLRYVSLGTYFYFLFPGRCSNTQFQCIEGICKHENDSDCKGSCIPKGWVRDGMIDCTDGSDEVAGK